MHKELKKGTFASIKRQIKKPLKVKYTYYLTPEVVGYSIQCLDYEGIITQGDTLNETLENAKEATLLIVDSLGYWPESKNITAVNDSFVCLEFEN